MEIVQGAPCFASDIDVKSRRTASLGLALRLLQLWEVESSHRPHRLKGSEHVGESSSGRCVIKFRQGDIVYFEAGGLTRA